MGSEHEGKVLLMWETSAANIKDEGLICHLPGSVKLFDVLQQRAIQTFFPPSKHSPKYSCVTLNSFSEVVVYFPEEVYAKT